MPGWWVTLAWAPARVKPAKVAVPKPSASPKVTMPTTVTGIGVGRLHDGAVADGEVAGGGRAPVDHDLVGGRRCAALDEAVGVELRVGRPSWPPWRGGPLPPMASPSRPMRAP